MYIDSNIIPDIDDLFFDVLHPNPKINKKAAIKIRQQEVIMYCPEELMLKAIKTNETKPKNKFDNVIAFGIVFLKFKTIKLNLPQLNSH